MIKNANNVPLPGTNIALEIYEWVLTYGAPDNLIDHGTNFANWTVDAGSSKGAGGVTIVQNGDTDLAIMVVSGLTPGETYWCRVNITDNAGAGNLRVLATGTLRATDDNDHDFDNGEGEQYVQLKANGSGPHMLALVHNGGSDTDEITFDAFNVYENPVRTAKVAAIGDKCSSHDSTESNLINNQVALEANDIENVVTCGDGADGSNSYSSIWDTLKSALAPGLIYSGTGNHDYDNTPITDPGNFLAYFPHIQTLSPASGALGTYYSKVLGNMEFFFMDLNAANTDITLTSEATIRASTMGQWLLGAVAASTARWKILIAHYPPYSSSAAGAGLATMRWTDLRTLGFHLYMGGHYHGLEIQDRTSDIGIYTVTLAKSGAGHHGWDTIDAETIWREEDTNIGAWIKIYDGDDDNRYLILEWISETGVMLHRDRIEYIPI